VGRDPGSTASQKERGLISDPCGETGEFFVNSPLDFEAPISLWPGHQDTQERYIVKVERRTVIGGAWGLQHALRDSEDSSKLNTSFVERLNLTIRQGSAYLYRRTICQVRWKERLEDRLELFRRYYNFVRPHRALKFGREVRTPAMQAGLTSKRLTFREIFSPAVHNLVL
jgi:hypothetical protein